MEKKSKPNPVVFTSQSTGVAEILDELVNSLNTTNNLKLEKPKLK